MALPRRIRLEDRLIQYSIVHRPRVTRRLHLELGEDGSLQVVVPRSLRPGSVQTMLQARAGQVLRFLDRARSRQQDIPRLEYTDGEWHWFLGERHALQVMTDGTVLSVGLAGRDLLSRRSPETGRSRVRDLLRAWYRQQAKQLFAPRLEAISGRAPWCRATPEWRLRRMKRTWGNCSSRGLITLNTHLVKAPPALIDYVIAHEICHLEQLNHSADFYALQDALNPDWREHRAELRAEGHRYLHD